MAGNKGIYWNKYRPEKLIGQFNTSNETIRIS